MSFNWLFLVVLVVILLFAFAGYKRGLIKVAYSLFSLVLTIALSLAITPFIEDFLLEKTALYDTVKEGFLNGLEQTADLPDPTQLQDTAEQVKALESYHLPSFVNNEVVDNMKKQVEILDFPDYLASYIAQLAVSAAAFLIGCILIKILVKIIFDTLDLIVKLPVLNAFNHSGGLILGFVQGLLIIWIFFVIITLLGGNSFGNDCMRMIKESVLLDWIYRNNIVMIVLSSFLNVA